MNATTMVTLEGLPQQQANAWNALLDIAPLLGEKWALIGGQVVVHQAEHNRSELPRRCDLRTALRTYSGQVVVLLVRR